MGLGGTSKDHAQDAVHYLERAEAVLSKARNAKSCRERFNISLEFNNLSGIANYAARQAWGFHPARNVVMLQKFETRLEKSVKKATRLDDQIRKGCLR
jgi:hypothetical protein